MIDESKVTQRETEEVIQAAARILIRTVLDLIQADPHQWSTRPCDTCRTITTIVGSKFGCYKKAEEARK